MRHRNLAWKLLLEIVHHLVLVVHSKSPYCDIEWDRSVWRLLIIHFGQSLVTGIYNHFIHLCNSYRYQVDWPDEMTITRLKNHGICCRFREKKKKKNKNVFLMFLKLNKFFLHESCLYIPVACIYEFPITV